METNQKIRAAFRLWKKLCEVENILFDHYADEFIDIHMDEISQNDYVNDDILLPFWSDKIAIPELLSYLLPNYHQKIA